MIGVAANLYRLTIQIITDAAKIAMQRLFKRWLYKMLSVFGAKYNVEIVVYQ